MFKVKMVLERETKGAVRYQEHNSSNQPVKGDDAVIGTLYVRKAAFTGPIPAVITVSIDNG